MTNRTSRRLVVIFVAPSAAPYFLNPGESLPKSWRELEIKEIREP